MTPARDPHALGSATERVSAARDELIRLADASLEIARAIEAQALLQRQAAERLYARAATERGA